MQWFYHALIDYSFQVKIILAPNQEIYHKKRYSSTSLTIKLARVKGIEPFYSVSETESLPLT